jgi:hypothetical protein
MPTALDLPSARFGTVWSFGKIQTEQFHVAKRYQTQMTQFARAPAEPKESLLLRSLHSVSDLDC